MRGLNKQLERVCKFASTDQTRYHLMSCHYSKELKALVATDGHRAIFDKSSYNEYDKDFKAEVYLKTSEMVPMDYGGTKYPNITVFYPDLTKYKTRFNFTVPEYIKQLAKYKKSVIGYFNAQGDLGLSKRDDSIISLDLRLLEPLAGCNAQVLIKDALTPLVFKLIDEPEVEVIVMPLRM
jgi:hypothetical protein